jgi:hypothetical protein
MAGYERQLVDFEHEDNQLEVSETSALDQFREMTNALDQIVKNKKVMLEGRFSTSTSVMKKYLKVAAHQIRTMLKRSQFKEMENWFDMMLILAERISFIEHTESLLPLPSLEVKKDFATPRELEELGGGIDAHWRVQDTIKFWKAEEEKYLAAIGFLQREAEKPKYNVNLEAECEDLYWKRKNDLEEILMAIDLWQNEGYSMRNYSTLYYRTLDEKEQLNPSRILDRVLVNKPVAKGEFATDIEWEKIPRTKWPKRQNMDQIVILDIKGSKIRSPFDHLRDPQVKLLNERWKEEKAKHEKVIVNLAEQASELETRGELHYRLSYRVQKRSSQLREEAAMLKIWLAEGYLCPHYGYRFIEIQNELATLTADSLFEEVQEKRKGQKPSSIGWRKTSQPNLDSDSD